MEESIQENNKFSAINDIFKSVSDNVFNLLKGKSPREILLVVAPIILLFGYWINYAFSNMYTRLNNVTELRDTKRDELQKLISGKSYIKEYTFLKEVSAQNKNLKKKNIEKGEGIAILDGIFSKYFKRSLYTISEQGSVSVGPQVQQLKFKINFKLGTLKDYEKVINDIYKHNAQFYITDFELKKNYRKYLDCQLYISSISRS